ncbi:MAG TPA: hypothetical protein PK821_05490 [Victivallales bacterium]|nr:hypothetical protein [Victivallales bacterium]
MKRSVFVLAIACLSFFSFAGEDKEKYEKIFPRGNFRSEKERQKAIDGYNKYKKIIEPLQAKIIFYGKVMDQLGNTVPEAEITFHVMGFDPNAYGSLFYGQIAADKKLKTDNNGHFVIENYMGFGLGIDEVKAKGYEYIYSSRETFFEYSPHTIEKIYVKDDFKGENNKEEFEEYNRCLAEKKPFFKPDKNSPVVFHLRKKGQQEFLLQGDNSISFSPDPIENVCYVDVVDFRGMGYHTDRDGYEGWVKEYHVDLQISARKIGKKTYIVFIVSDKESGLLKLDEKLYIAPDDGYATELVIDVETLPSEQDKQMYLYLKGRGGKIYSRIEIETDKPGITIKNIWTNPRGSKILEPLEEEPVGDVKSKLLKKILKEFGYKDI